MRDNRLLDSRGGWVGLCELQIFLVYFHVRVKKVLQFVVFRYKFPSKLLIFFAFFVLVFSFQLLDEAAITNLLLQLGDLLFESRHTTAFPAQSPRGVIQDLLLIGRNVFEVTVELELAFGPLLIAVADSPGLLRTVIRCWVVGWGEVLLDLVFEGLVVVLAWYRI